MLGGFLGRMIVLTFALNWGICFMFRVDRVDLHKISYVN